MPDPGDASLAVAVAILLVGTRLTDVADVLADRTGLGEAPVGAVLLGATTSLPGIVASVTATADGHAGCATISLRRRRVSRSRATASGGEPKSAFMNGR